MLGRLFSRKNKTYQVFSSQGTRVLHLLEADQELMGYYSIISEPSFMGDCATIFLALSFCYISYVMNFSHLPLFGIEHLEEVHYGLP